MMGFDEHKAAPDRQEQLSFATYFLAGSGILVVAMFLIAALYLAGIG